MLIKFYSIFLLILITNTKRIRQEQHELLFCIVSNCPLEYSECVANFYCSIVEADCYHLKKYYGKSLLQTKEYIQCLQSSSDAVDYANCCMQNCGDVESALSLKARHPLQKVMRVMHKLAK